MHKLTIGALLLPGILYAQEAAVISTTMSNTEYPPGDYQEEIATRKPANANKMRSVLDRKDLMNPAVKVAWSVWYSLDEGKTFKQWAAASTFGGPVPNGSTSSAFFTAAPPEGSLIINKMTVTGGTAKTGTVLQMWEVK
jgi:hypothetical protein